jgi:hypothetical protein
MACGASGVLRKQCRGRFGSGGRPDGRGPPSLLAGASPGEGLRFLIALRARPLQPLANGPVTGSGCIELCGRGPRPQAAGLDVGCCGAQAFGSRTRDGWRGRRVVYCASSAKVVSNLWGICPSSPPAGDRAVPYNPSQTALSLAAGESNRAVVGRVPMLLDSRLGAGRSGVVRKGRRGSRFPNCWPRWRGE